jgi:NAD(P)-dependent dehydrogenase (short-subunit alcohol dehydrogenase family)
MSVSSLDGKVALVTGAGSGIGKAVCLALAEFGCLVAVVDRAQDRAAAVVAEIGRGGGRCLAVTADLAEREAPAAAVGSAVAHFGGIDILINNVGLFSRTGLFDVTYQLWDELVAVNLRSALFLTKFAAESMRARGGGRIVNISSASGYTAGGGSPVYACTKAAIGGLTRNTAAELAPYGINVNAVAPGLTMTDSVPGDPRVLDDLLTHGVERNLFHRVGEPGEVASLVAHLCRPESRHITGQVIHVSGGAVV